MKNIIITSLIVLTGVVTASAQWRLDIVGGISPGANPGSAGLIVNRHLPHEEFLFNIGKVDPQFFVGIKSQVQLGAPFFIESGLMYSRKKSSYDINYTVIDTEHPVPYHIMNETDHQLLLPLNIGVNLGSFDVMSGFRLTQSISKKSELDKLSGFTSNGNPTQIGWQASAGYTFLRNRIGLEYQGNFSRVGSGMMVNNQSLELLNIPGQIALMVNHSF